MNKSKYGYSPMLEEPDAYDAAGNKTVNSWKLFMEDELAREANEEDSDD